MTVKLISFIFFFFLSQGSSAMIPGSMSSCEEPAASGDGSRAITVAKSVCDRETVSPDAHAAVVAESTDCGDKRSSADVCGGGSPIWKMFVYVAEVCFLVLVLFVSIYCCRRKRLKQI